MILEGVQEVVQEVLELEQALVLLWILVAELFVISSGMVLELEVMVQKVLELEMVMWVGLGVDLQLGALCEVVEILLQTSA